MSDDVLSPPAVQGEAEAALQDILKSITSEAPELVATLRRCLYVSTLLDWRKDAGKFRLELSGYPPSSELPLYRKGVPAQLTWQPRGADAFGQLIARQRRGYELPSDSTTVDAPWGISDLLKYGEAGVTQLTGKSDRMLPGSNGSYAFDEVLKIRAASCSKVVDQITNDVVEWASSAYRTLRLGNIAAEIWAEHRADVDAFLAHLSLDGHVSTISHGLSSDEPQQWREAMWSCRDLLHDVAGFLWLDERNKYPYLKGDDGKPIQVTPEKYVNRLMAYLHQKGVTGATGTHLRAEWARLRALNSLASSAHDASAVTREDARLTFFSIYALLGELVKRTDTQPVKEFTGMGDRSDG